MSQTMKLCENVGNQLGFKPGRYTTEPIFSLRQKTEKYKETQGKLFAVFID